MWLTLEGKENFQVVLLELLHLNSDFETWNDNLHESSQVLTGSWDNSWSDLTFKIVCWVRSAHKWATYDYMISENCYRQTQPTHVNSRARINIPQCGHSYSIASCRLSHVRGNTFDSKMGVTCTQSTLDRLEGSASNPKHIIFKAALPFQPPITRSNLHCVNF